MRTARALPMKIGELAAAADTPVDTIRYYERLGLLGPPPPRSAGNYRLYGEPLLQRLRFIRRARALDLSLDEVRALLVLRDAPQADCAAADALLDAHLGHVRQRIAELRALQRELQALRAQCSGDGDAAHCGVLRGLQGALPGTPAPAARHATAGHPELGRVHRR